MDKKFFKQKVFTIEIRLTLPPQDASNLIQVYLEKVKEKQWWGKILAWSRDYPGREPWSVSSREIRELQGVVEERRDEIIQYWHDHFSSDWDSQYL